jgi:hypothetical protein
LGPGGSRGLGGVVEALPDYHRDLRHLLVDGCWFSAHLVDTGTTPTSRSISIQEFAMYRVAAGRIVEVWVIWIESAWRCRERRSGSF